MTLDIFRVTDWTCPNCGKTDQTREIAPHTRYHPCPGLHGLSAPMVEAGVRAKVYMRERDDYVGADAGRVTLAPETGRPVMSIITERENGQDVAVFAPVATGAAKV